MSALKVQEPGPKYCHFPLDESRGYDTYYFSGLLSEKLELTQTKRGNVWRWVKIPGHNRNEALDCRNYANAGFRIINPDTFMVEKRLKGIDDIVEQPRRPQRPKKSRTSQSEDW